MLGATENRKDEIARRKRLGLPLDGLIDPKLLVREAAGEGGAAGKPKLPPRGPAPALGGSHNRYIGYVALVPRSLEDGCQGCVLVC